MNFIGIDLAWSDRNTSGGVAIEEHAGVGRVVAAEAALGDDADLLRWLGAAAGDGDALIAVDAPLIVPNAAGARPCERLITRRFGRYQAGARPAYRGSPSLGPRIRGEELVAALAALGFAHTPKIVARAPARQVFEVYPHPAMIVLFGLDRTLKYKHLLDRPARLGEYRRYQALLRSLADAHPALEPPRFLERDVAALAGRALKSFEDLLDALFCAYIAYWCWHYGPHGYEVFGDLATGYIVVPRRAGGH